MKTTTRTFNTTVELNNQPFEVAVEYRYLPATPDVYYLSNGDPGHPGDPEEAEIEGVFLTVDRNRLNDLSPSIPDEAMDKLVDQACELGREAWSARWDEADAAYDDRRVEDMIEAAAQGEDY